MNISKSKHREEIFFNACFDKNSVKNLVSWFLNTYGEKATLNFLESLKTLGFHQATQAGVSLGLDDLQIPQEKPSFITKAHIATQKIEQQVAAGSLTSVEKSQCLIDTWNQTSDLLRQAAVQNFRKTNLLNPVYMMAFSGARGNVSQVRQLVGMRGLMADPQGAILEFPIQSNFREGLTVTEYLISCYGARKGLVDTALRTATSGYLTRRLVDSAQQAVISMRDCGTLRATVLEGKNLESRLIGRVLANSLAMERNHAPQPLRGTTHALEAQLDFEMKISFGRNHLICATDAKIISKNYTQISVRSPLTCESTTSVCQLCYGWNLATGKLVQMGEAVGVIAAQSIGEPGTQLTMRTFHTGGVGVFANQALQPILAPYKGKLIFHHPLTGHFIRTPYGKIAYMMKQSPIQGDRIICTLEPFSKVDRVLTIREQDLTPGSLLFVKHGEHVEPKHVLFQISQLKLTKQTLPESSHPVYSPAEGQIFLESMSFFIEKEIPTTKEKERVNPVFSSKESGVQRMKKLGTFWVLAASNQHEIHGAESTSFSSRSKAPQQTCSFLETGDFISKNSILFQYNFYSSSKTQLKKIQSKLIFGVYTLQIPLETIAFFQRYYRFTSPNGTFVYRKQSTKNGLLIWYPTVREKRKDSVSRRKLLISKAPQHNAVASPSDNVLYSSAPRSSTTVVYRHIPSLYTQVFKTVTPHIGQSPQGLRSSASQNGKKSQDAHNGQDSQELSKIQGMVFGIQLFFPNTQFFNNKYLRKNFSSCFILNQNILETNLISSNFLTDIFEKNSKQKTFVNEPTSLLSTQGWVLFSPKKTTPESFLRRQFIPTGLIFETLCFPKCSISVKTLSSVSFGQRKKLQNYYQKRDWYAPAIFEDLGRVVPLRGALALLGSHNTTRTKESLRYEIQKNVCPIRNGVVWYSSLRQTNKKGLFKKTIQNFVSLKTFLLIQSVVESRLPNQQEIQKQASILAGKSLVQNPHTALFSKQKPTKIQLKAKIHWKLQFSTELQNIVRGATFSAPQSGIDDAKWISQAHLWKAHATIRNISDQPHKYVQFQNVSTTYSRGISVFQYQLATFKNPKKFTFTPGYQNWISPIQPFTQGLVKIHSSGEFLLKTQTTQGTSLSLLRKEDLLTLKTDTSQFSKLGSLIRWGDEIEPGKACEYNGQVVKKTTNTLTLRLGSPFLAPLRCILHVSQNTLVQKNDLLITLKSRQLQTEDIVQGIPKIEQLFEARESLSGEILSDTVHIRLKNAYKRELESLNITTHWSIAVEKSFLEAQHFLVEQILDAYETQGVKISEKHVEVIVRQMTNRVRILDPGETGLLEGEVVQHTWIKKFNQQIRSMGLRDAMYEPLVLGISKSVLQSESFLLAASFQEVSRVLVRSALSKKRDFLHGLHENVIIGQMIPAGTGLVSQGSSKFLS